MGMMAGEGLVNDHMGAAGQEGGTCEVPCSPDLIRGPGQEEDQLSLSLFF